MVDTKSQPEVLVEVGWIMGWIANWSKRQGGRHLPGRVPRVPTEGRAGNKTRSWKARNSLTRGLRRDDQDHLSDPGMHTVDMVDIGPPANDRKKLQRPDRGQAVFANDNITTKTNCQSVDGRRVATTGGRGLKGGWWAESLKGKWMVQLTSGSPGPALGPGLPGPGPGIDTGT